MTIMSETVHIAAWVLNNIVHSEKKKTVYVHTLIASKVIKHYALKTP